MHSVEAQDPSVAYRIAFNDLVQMGQEVEVRGRKTVELLHYVTTVGAAWNHTIQAPGRDWNPFIAMSEILWFFSGRNDIEPLKKFNRNISQFSDDGLTLNGSAYGYRIKDQIDDAIGRLEADLFDRRAVINVWNTEDLTAQTKDPPCNDMFMFKVRNRKLDMVVFNRSNDIHWGLFAVNYPVFSSLMEYVAHRLQVGMGSYIHFSDSLHYYTDQEQPRKITEAMIKHRGDGLMVTAATHEMFDSSDSADLGYIRSLANAALEGDEISDKAHSFFVFARDYLIQQRDPDFRPRHAGKFPDWIETAKAWRHGHLPV